MSSILINYTSSTERIWIYIQQQLKLEDTTFQIECRTHAHDSTPSLHPTLDPSPSPSHIISAGVRSMPKNSIE